MALAQPPLSLRKVRVLFHILDSVKGKFERLIERMLNSVCWFCKFNPALASIAFYVLCTGAWFILWIAMRFLFLYFATRNRVLEVVIHVMEGLNEHVLLHCSFSTVCLPCLWDSSYCWERFILISMLIATAPHLIQTRWALCCAAPRWSERCPKASTGVWED